MFRGLNMTAVGSRVHGSGGTTVQECNGAMGKRLRVKLRIYFNQCIHMHHFKKDSVYKTEL